MQQNGREESLATGLGWFSIGLGLSEVLAAGPLARMIGATDDGKTRKVLRTYGLREIAAGIGILSQPTSAGWLWGRVAGDMMDLASLGVAFKDGNKTRLALATAAVAGVTALDVYCGKRLSESDSSESSSEVPTSVTRAITVNGSAEEMYRFWRDCSNMPKFMDGLEFVRVLDNTRSHWVQRIPGGKTIEWDSEITEDRPGNFIAWRANAPAGLDHSGSVTFKAAPGGRGTIVRLELQRTGGAISSLITKLFTPGIGVKVEQDLRRFKQLMETGEVVRSDATVHTGMHPAQPPVKTPEPAMSLA